MTSIDVRPAYRDPELTVDERVADLLGRMTRREKLAQLGSIWAFDIVGANGLDRDRMAAALADGLGEITRLAGATNLRPTEVAEAANAIQHFLVEETRLGIPTIVHEESLHGLLAWGAPCFQQAIGAAASFDPSLVEEAAATIRLRMLATGARHALAPVLDIGRDPRWGRIEETYGEDPYVAASMGIAYVRGLQGDDISTGVIATGKHMVGHGMPEGGLNQGPVHVGWRELRDEQLFPFEAAVRAGMRSVMPAYCDVDGVPCHGSVELFRTILREEWGFDGIVSSDYLGVELIARAHGLTDDLGAAGGLALAAGVDLELPRTAAYGPPLDGAIERGAVDETLLDSAVARVLRMKFLLGLFEQPLIDLPSDADIAHLAEAESRAAARLAAGSIVLLENDGVLPLAADVGSIAVIGPIADSARDLLGDYSHLVHIETLREMRNESNAFGFAVRDEVVVADELAGRETILDAMRERFGSATIRYAMGCGLRDGTDAQIAEAVDAAAGADAAVLVLGERSGLTEDSTTGEFRDRSELGLIGRQQELLEAVVATGTPVVLVLVSGRPLALEWAARHCAAIVVAWVPGDAGPAAVTAVLAGDANPGGKLPVSFPRSVGQVPIHYRHHPTGGRSNPKGDYVDGSVAPLWPFGHGRSYTRFEVSGLRLDRSDLPIDGGEIAATIDVANVGDRPGDEVIQLYVRDEEASVARPVIELRGFARIGLAPGERRTVTFRLAPEQFAYVGADYRRVVEPGRVSVFVGTSARDLPLRSSFELAGAPIEVRCRSRFLSTVDVE